MVLRFNADGIHVMELMGEPGVIDLLPCDQPTDSDPDEDWDEDLVTDFPHIDC